MLASLLFVSFSNTNGSFSLFSGVSFMDSSGIGLVMGRYKLMKNLSGKVFIENAPRQIKKVLRMAGIEKMLSEKSGKEVLV